MIVRTPVLRPIWRYWRPMLVVLATVGCASQGPPIRVASPLAAQPEARPDTPEGPEYRLQPGDMLELKFFYTPELNESVTVRPDGRITLQLVEEVDALGRTVEELTRTLRDGYAGILTRPEIAVILRKSTGQK